MIARRMRCVHDDLTTFFQPRGAAACYDRGMKVHHEEYDGGVRVWVSGDLDSSQCNCLRAFWDCHIDEAAARVDIDLTELDSLDGESVAVMVDIVRGHLSRGADVSVHLAPQMLAHTFYKIGLLTDSRFQLIDPREEEPYG